MGTYLLRVEGEYCIAFDADDFETAEIFVRSAETMNRMELVDAESGDRISIGATDLGDC